MIDDICPVQLVAALQSERTGICCLRISNWLLQLWLFQVNSLGKPGAVMGIGGWLI